MRVHPQRDIGRDDHLQVADVDARLDVRLARGELQLAEVELERADPEPVVVARSSCMLVTTYVAVADAAAEVDVEHGDEDRHGDERRARRADARTMRDPGGDAPHAARVLGLGELLRVRSLGVRAPGRGA